MLKTTATTPDAGLVPYDDQSRERYRSRGWWTGRSLPAELLAAAEGHADRVALVTPEVRWTYRDLFGRAAAFPLGLDRQLGITPGEPVMFQMGNVAETIVAYLGALVAGARPVCTLPQHGTREIGLLAEHVGARVLFTQADYRRDRLVGQAEELLAGGKIQDVLVARGDVVAGAVAFADVLDAGAGADPWSLPGVRAEIDDVAVFQLSGGTTGLPKVAPRLHEEYVYNSRAWAQAMGYTPETRLLYPLPVMHNAGIALAVQPAILSGSQLVLAPSADVDALVALIVEHDIEVLPLVPPALAVRLLDAPAAQAANMSSLRDFVVGGQKLPVEVAQRLRDELGIAVRQMFGMAEGLFLLTPREAGEDVRHHMVGAPISPDDEVRILAPDGAELHGEELGELAARGPYTIRGYYRAEAHNEDAFTPDGFYRTGDLAQRHITPSGTFYSIEGRIKDVINRGVEKIHAEEVEELIVQHPSVSTAALVAMPDPVLGERACAYLVMAEGAPPLTVDSLADHLLALGLAKYKLPERVEMLDALPLTNVGKVSKKDLRVDVQRRLANEQESAR